MIRLFLVRHGETIANAENRYQGSSDYPLSDIGLSQAKQLHQLIKDIPFSQVFSSDLQRSVLTAEIASGGKNPQQVSQLRERHFGVWENLKATEIKETWPELHKQWTTNPVNTIIPGAETHEEVFSRVREGLAVVHSNYQSTAEPENFLAVFHGGINRYILCHYLGLTIDSFWKISQDNCCINLIEFNNNHPTVTLLNYTADSLTRKLNNIY